LGGVIDDENSLSTILRNRFTVGQIFFQWFSVFSTGNTGAAWRENDENDPKGNQMILAELLPPVAVGYRVWVI
jgi:hypothetical protein